MTQLNKQHAAEVEDIITSVPKHEPYDLLKAELARRLSNIREKRVRQLLFHEDMADRKPSQFLRLLEGLAPDVPDDFLLIISAGRLPPHVKAIFAGQAEDSLDSVSQLAGRICEVTAYHSERLPFDARYYRRSTRRYCGAHAPGCLNAGITTRQLLAVQRPPPLATQRLPPQQSKYPPTPHDTC